MINTVNPCENCSTVRNVNEPGYKVFTFRNPYLGNTCVPFLHWACDYNCAKDIEIPGKVEKILKGSMDSIPSPSRSREHLNFYFLFFWPNIAGHCQQAFGTKKFIDNAQQCLAFTPQANFPAHT